jgi:hypothetical protein
MYVTSVTLEGKIYDQLVIQCDGSRCKTLKKTMSLYLSVSTDATKHMILHSKSSIFHVYFQMATYTKHTVINYSNHPENNSGQSLLIQKILKGGGTYSQN